MRTALVLIVMAWPGATAWARSCAGLLYSEPGRARVVTTLDFDRSGVRAAETLGIKPGNVMRFVARQGLTLIDHPDGGVYGVLFNPDPRRLDKGYVLRGVRVDDRLVVHSFYESSVNEDLKYFKQVAEVHGVTPRRLLLKRAILKCPTLVLQAATQVKLWLKHRVPVEEVIDFLNSARKPPEAHRAPYNGKHRFVVDGFDRRGRQMRVVIQDEGLCPNGLITAYEMR